MATRTTVLEVELVSDPSKVVSSFEDAGNAAKDMGDKIDRASKVADDGASRVDRAADATDNLASKSSQATGGLGALSAGFELVGAEKYAGALQGAAMATDFFSGVGDISNLVLQSTAVQTAKNSVLKAKDIVVTGAQTVATVAQTAATKALGLAMKALPFLAIATVILTVIGLFVLLYKKNERFRDIVQSAMRVAREGIGKVVDGVRNLIGWIKDKAVLAFKVWKTLVVGYIKLVTLPIRLLITGVVSLIGWVKDKGPAAFATLRDRVATIVSSIRDKIGAIIDTGRRVVDWIRDNLAAAFTTAKDKIKAPIDAVLGWIQNMIDKVQDLIGWIKDIKLPKLSLPDVNPFNKAGPTSSRPTSSSSSGSPTYNVVINVNGALDPVSTATQIRDLLKREGLWTGTLVTS